MPAHVAATAAAAGLSLACNAEGRTAWHFAETAVSAFEAAAFEARSTAHSGIGLFAVRDICAGERLPCEAPLARWSVAAQASEDERRASFEAMLATLTPETIAAIMELSQSTTHGTQKNLLGTWQTNGLPINYDNGQPRQGQQVGERTREAAVFANVCRLNHACAPNCHHEWNERLGRETVHTVRNVRAGEELTICYLPPRGLEQQARRHRLMATVEADPDAVRGVARVAVPASRIEQSLPHGCSRLDEVLTAGRHAASCGGADGSVPRRGREEAQGGGTTLGQRLTLCQNSARKAPAKRFPPVERRASSPRSSTGCVPDAALARHEEGS
jgi:hypothetical protein